MRFSEVRAEAFARYTLPGLLKKSRSSRGGKFILWMKRSELASVLGMTNARQEHALYVADHAAKENIVTAILPGWVYFFYDDESSSYGDQIDVSDATPITDAFAKVYGSEACDDMWEEWIENGTLPGALAKQPKSKGIPRKQAAS